MNEPEAQAAALAAYFDRHPAAIRKQNGVAVFRALPGAYLDALGGPAYCLQGNRPLADELARQGFPPVTELPPVLDQAIVFATKHREEILYHLALAAERLRDGGVLIVSAANALGASSLERRCTELMGPVDTFSKHKCRVIRAHQQTGRLNQGLLKAWRQAGALQRVAATGFYSGPGVFSWKRLDTGSALLAAHLPADLRGRGADLGAGYGYLSHAALTRAPGIAALHLFEAESRALDAARLNLRELASPADQHFHWADVTAGLGLSGLDFVIMNPPFHAGRGAVPVLGQAFVRAALAALRSGGRLFMVANRHLPYEGALQAASAEIRTLAEEAGFKVIAARKA